MKQKKLDECWDTVNEQIEKSTILRIKWKEIFGHTLTEHITTIKEKNPNIGSIEIFEMIKKELVNLQINNNEILRRIYISVCARYGEQKIYVNRTKKNI